MKRLFARLDLADSAVVKQVIDYACILVQRAVEWFVWFALGLALLGGAHWLFTH